MNDKMFYVFATLEYGSGYEKHEEAFEAYEKDDSEVKGVFAIKGYGSVSSINVKTNEFTHEMTMLKMKAEELTKQYREK